MGAIGGLARFAQSAFQDRAEGLAAQRNMGELYRSARLEEANAAGVLRQGVIQSAAARQRGSEVLGQQQLGFALGNVSATSGTSAQVQRSTAAYGELDAQTLANNARRAALGHREVARRYRADAEEVWASYERKAPALIVSMLGNAAGSFTGGGL